MNSSTIVQTIQKHNLYLLHWNSGCTDPLIRRINTYVIDDSSTGLFRFCKLTGSVFLGLARLA